MNIKYSFTYRPIYQLQAGDWIWIEKQAYPLESVDWFKSVRRVTLGFNGQTRNFHEWEWVAAMIIPSVLPPVPPAPAPIYTALQLTKSEMLAGDVVELGDYIFTVIIPGLLDKSELGTYLESLLSIREVYNVNRPDKWEPSAEDRIWIEKGLRWIMESDGEYREHHKDQHEEIYSRRS